MHEYIRGILSDNTEPRAFIVVTTTLPSAMHFERIKASAIAQLSSEQHQA